ncbi:MULTISPECIES: ATP-binding protein [unclassified Streptomyces]|uniref:ATP-binding protein n=1 Tax=unclassified Streptomyces TaxID=2593676 RepID=UPI0033C26BB8
MARDIPLRKSLLARLLAVSVLVSVGSIAATAWLAAQTTSGALRQEQGQVLADDARIYDKLIGIGASAPEWRGADEAVRELSRRTGRRIALTTQDRRVIADSATPRRPGSPTAAHDGEGGEGGKGGSGSDKGGPGKGGGTGKTEGPSTSDDPNKSSGTNTADGTGKSGAGKSNGPGKADGAEKPNGTGESDGTGKSDGADKSNGAGGSDGPSKADWAGESNDTRKSDGVDKADDTGKTDGAGKLNDTRKSDGVGKSDRPGKSDRTGKSNDTRKSNETRKSNAPAPAPRTSLPPTPSAVLDPLAVDSMLAPGRTDGDAGPDATAADRIDPRAVGPYRLTEAERTRLRQAADRSAACLSELGAAPEVVVGPSGRPTVQVEHDLGDYLKASCRMPPLDLPTTTEQKALKKLNSLSDACMKRHGLPAVPVGLDLSGRSGPRPVGTVVPTTGAMEPYADPTSDPGADPDPPSDPVRGSAERPPRTPPDTDTGTGTGIASRATRTRGSAPAATTAAAATAAASCVDTARREQLGPYVSAPALLFITASDGTRSTPGFSLSRDNTVRLAGLAAAVLAVTVAVTALAATRLTRPLRALTAATWRMKTGEAGAPVPERATRSAGEISQLAAAFNDMAAHRKALEEQRKAMVSDVAHELRTPLSNIRGWLEAAEDGVVETDPELVTSLLEEALLLQHIVDDLQDLAAADAGTLRLHREPAHAADIAEQVAAAHQARADAAGVRLRATAYGDPLVSADPLRLRQAIGNLVSNAVRHTPRGGSVRISCRTTADGVLIEVADTGTGIDAADLPHVFDRFWRADKSRTRATGGSGLGLSIVRKLVEAHEGTVTAQSVPGKGSLFTVRLPEACGRDGAAP